jgi:hypothetical protein
MPDTPHKVSNYVPAGKGMLYLGEWEGSTPPAYPADFEEIGNCPSLNLEPTRETRPHYSSRQGLRTRDLNPTVEMGYNVNFECDEIAAANLAKFFMGSLQANGDIYGMQAYDKEYAAYFISHNPIGPNKIYKMWKITVGPSGPLQLIGDEYLVLSYAGEGLADIANHPESPFFTISPEPEDTSTTTTTSA